MQKEWLDFLRDQYPNGSRIKLRETAGENAAHVAPGSMGTLEHIDESGVFHVQWDNGSQSNVVIGKERFSVLPPEPTTLKLYMPLTADIVEYNEYGDLDDELSCELDGRALTGYEDKILAALARERLPEEAERGIMHWYHADDSVNEKVHSVVFNAEVRNRRLWGVAECCISGELTPEEMDLLKNFVRGQASDGWGERFEQHELRVDDGVMYVHLWNSTFWSILTEQERFSPDVAEGLPAGCLTTLPSTGALIWIKRGENGYLPSNWETGDPVENREKADFANKYWGVTPAQEQAMLCGSMFGWGVPGADPKFYEQNKLQMGEV